MENGKSQTVLEGWTLCFSSYNCYFAALQPTLGHHRGSILTNSIWITKIDLFWPEGPQEPCNKIETQSLAKNLVKFEPETSQFWM